MADRTAPLQVRFTFTEKEWERIKGRITTGDKAPSLTSYFRKEVSRHFEHEDVKCEDSDIVVVKKHFFITDRKSIILIRCLAERLEITPSTLLERIIFSPHLKEE